MSMMRHDFEERPEPEPTSCSAQESRKADWLEQAFLWWCRAMLIGGSLLMAAAFVKVVGGGN